MKLFPKLMLASVLPFLLVIAMAATPYTSPKTGEVGNAIGRDNTNSTAKPTYHNLKTSNSRTSKVSANNLLAGFIAAPYVVPSISYPAGAKSYPTGTAITPLTITNTGGAVPATTPATVTTFAGSGTGSALDGTGTAATFNFPLGIGRDASDNLYVAEYSSNKIRKITPAGVVTTFAGSGTQGSFDNATGTLATFSGPFGVAVDASGNLYVADRDNNKIRKISSTGSVSTFAGSGTASSIDATGTSATFTQPSGIVIDASGNLYVADANSNKIRKITSAGIVTTFAGSGTATSVDNITGTLATFNKPVGIAIDASNNIYVGEENGNKIRKISSSGAVTTLAGSGSIGAADNNNGLLATFNQPDGLAVDILGNVYVSVRQSNKIRKISSSGVVTTLAGSSSGSTEGTGTSAQFSTPWGLVLDALSNNLYVADASNNKIRKIALLGYSISPALPTGLSFDATTGTISGTPTVVTAATDYTVTAVNTDGAATTTVNIAVTLPTPTINITGTLTAFSSCIGTASATAQSFSVSGNTLTADINITAPTGFELAATTAGVYSSNLTLTQTGGTVAITSVFARLAATALGSPSGAFTATSAGATAKSITATGTVNALPTVNLGAVSGVLTNVTSFSLPYSGATGSPNQYSISTVSPIAMSSFTAVSNATLGATPVSVTIPASGANTYNFSLNVKNSTTGCVSAANAFTLVVSAPVPAPNISYAGSTQIYRVGTAITPLTMTNAGGAVPTVPTGGLTTFAGSGAYTSIDGTGTAASFKQPVSAALDASGNLYVGDGDGNKIRKITPAGVVTTFAGSGTAGLTNGTGTSASFSYPSGVAVDAAGNVYVSDYYNHTIRKITSAGVVTTLAGSGTSGSTNGTGTAASFSYPERVAVDASGNVYVADRANNKIRKITSAGVVTTLAGSGTFGSVDGTGTAASFNYPYGVAVDASGNVYVSDGNGHKIRKVTSGGVVTTIAGTGTFGFIDANGTAAKFYNPEGIALDVSGNVYVADFWNQKIRKISPTADVTTIAGNGNTGSVDNANPLSGSFYYPSDIAVDATGNTIYVVDRNNNTIRRIAPASGLSISPALPAGLSFDVTNGTISGTPTAVASATVYTITGVNGTGSSTTTVTLSTISATMNITGSLSNFTTCSGSASTPQSFTVAGSNLTADISIIAPSGFELATTSGGVYNNSITLTQSSGLVSNAQVFIRLAATATATTVGGAVTCTSSSATSKSININSIITVITTPATPVITGATALTVCSGSSVVLNSNGTGGSQWYLNGNPIANATSSSYTASSGGSYTIISSFAAITKICSSATSLPAVVTINSNPVATITQGSLLAFANCATTTINLSANTGTGLSYQWSNASGVIATATSQQFTVTASGDYNVKVTDANNCFAISASTKILSVPTATAGGNTAVCAGTTVGLSAGGTFVSPTYQWLKDGTAITGATSATYTAIATGNYNVSITSAGTTTGSCAVSVTINPLPSITTAAIPGNTVCTGTPLNINSTVSGTNSYQWLNGGNAISGATLSSLNIIASGSYSVKVTDANGCINTSTASTLAVNPLPTPSAITGTTAVKATNTTTLLSTPTGGVWSSSNTAVATVSSAGVVTGVAAGSATISYAVTNSSNCSATVTALVTVTALTPKPIITAGSTTNLCSGGSVVLTSNATSSNQWYKNGTVIGGANGGTFTATTSGSFTVAAGVDAVSSDAIQVIVNPNPDASIKEGAQLAFGDCATTSITLTASNTLPGTTYQWRNAGGDIVNATNQQYTVTQADNYSLRVTDVNNCMATSGNTKVTAVPSASSGGSTVVCAGTSVTLSVNASAFTSPTYQWQNSGTNITGATSATYSSTATGNYSVVVTDGILISTSCAIVVTVNALPTVTITSNTIVCAGNIVNLAATATATSYQWLGSGNAINSATASSYSTAVSDQYSVQVTDNNGCSNTSTASTVTVNSLPILSAIAGSGSVCVNSTVNLSNTATDGVWSSSNTAVATVDVTGQVTGIATGTATITYTVTTNACSTAVTKTITVNPSTNIVTQPVTNLVQCAGSNASISITATGTGLGYQWYQNGAAITGASAATYIKTSLVAADAGNYTVVVTGGCSNVTSDASIWTVNPLLSLPGITGVNNVCAAGATTQLANTLAGGIWSTTTNTFATINTTTGLVTGVSPGSTLANYTVTSLAGCVTITSTNITVNPLPTVSIVPANSVVVLGLTTQLNSTVGGGVTTYNWSPAANLNNATTANPIARVIANTTYTLLVTNATGCTATASTTVLVIENLFVQPTNVFTPNGDGINDRFTIKNLDVYPVNTLQVFDRTGKILYEKNNYTNDWDGTVSGRLLTKDTYYYVLSVKGTIVKRGTITLVR